MSFHFRMKVGYILRGVYSEVFLATAKSERVHVGRYYEIYRYIDTCTV